MQLQSVSNQSFERNGRRDRVDAMIKLDDIAIQRKAYEKAMQQVDDKRNRRITNTLFYSAPIAAGISRTLLTDSGNTTLFTKEISGVAGRMAKGIKTAAFLTTALAAVDLLGFARRKVSDNSQEVRNFEHKHPGLSFMATLGAGIALLTALPFGIAKLGNMFKPEFTNKIADKVGKYANKINDSNSVDVIRNAYHKLGEHTPNWLKLVGAVALDWSPTALLLGGMVNSIKGNNDKISAFIQNYNNMKEKQVNLSRARLKEISNFAVAQNALLHQTTLEKAALQLQNDLLMQDINNQKEMAILADAAKADMPQEVVDKVDELRAGLDIKENNLNDTGSHEINDAAASNEEIPQEESVVEE